MDVPHTRMQVGSVRNKTITDVDVAFKWKSTKVVAKSKMECWGMKCEMLD